jgi:glycosyltransferase involved in cell wall biosynthesis
MQPVSLVVITRDAAAQIAACLDSVPFAAEVVVVDSGSRDDTVQIAASRGARVLRETWRGFGAQRQFAVEQAASDWVLCLDADERLTPALAASIRETLAAPAHDGYELCRCNRFLGRWLRHGEGYPDWTLRLFRRSRGRWTDDAVHERVACTGAVGRLRGDLLHDSAESLERYLDKQNLYSTLQAQAMAQRGEIASWWKLAASPLARFLKFYFFRLGLLDGVPGLVHIGIGCFAAFAKYAKLAALAAERNRA